MNVTVETLAPCKKLVRIELDEKSVETAFETDAQPESVLMRARKLGLIVSRLPSLEESRDTPQLAPVELRPSAAPYS